MNYKLIVILVICCILTGCAISMSPATFKKQMKGENYATYFIDAPVSLSYISERELTLCQDPDYGNIYPPEKHWMFELGLGGEYMFYINNGLMLFPGTKVSCRFPTTNYITTGWYEYPWDRRYHASLDPTVIIEPYFGSEMRIFPKSDFPFFFKISMGIPCIFYLWKKYYDLQDDVSYKNWERYYIEYDEIWDFGLSGKASLEIFCFGISYSLRYSKVKILNKETECFIHGFLVYFTLNDKKL